MFWLRDDAAVAYSQPPRLAGGLLQSSWWSPDGSDYDQQVWDGFTLKSEQTIAAIGWRGGHDPARGGSGGPVIDFTVRICTSSAGPIEPNASDPPLVEYSVGGNAGETLAGRYGGAVMFDYEFGLPAPVRAVAGRKYWLQVAATQKGIPDWGIAVGTGGDGSHIMRAAGTHVCLAAAEDAAFILLTPDRRSR